MDNDTLFYAFGGVAAISAVVLTFAGLKIKNFPGRVLPLVIVWFAVLAVGSSAFAVRYSQEEAEHREHESHQTEHAEEAESGPYENEGGALGGESEELEEEAEEEAGGQTEEESVGPTESPEEKGDDPAQEGQKESGGTPGASSGDEASTTTLQLAADPEALLFEEEELTAKAGKVTIDFDNPSVIEHNVVIEQDGKEIAGIEPITESEKSLSADLEAGSYMYVCTVPGHEEAGMVGTLTVE